METVAITHLVAMLVGVVLGIVIALPWRPLIRRKIQTRNIAELSRQLHEAIAELERQEARERAEPFSGPLGELPA